MAPLRISAISFLNTAPLMWDFEHADAARDFEIEYTIPAACAAKLAENQADVGLIPAITYAEITGLVILPNIAIAAKDRVRSILLVSKKPIEEVKTVATDTSSRTSVALLQVLFTKFFGGHRQFAEHAPHLKAMLQRHDAALLIGDAALEITAGKENFVYDLAHLWRERTGQPFVFAVWAVRLDSLGRAPRDLDLARVFQQSRDHGLEPENLRTIAQEWSHKVTLSERDIYTYLTENIDYYLDRENHAGLQLFLRYSQEVGLIPSAPELRFLGPLAFGSSRK
jgi:chorismate dehydratase